METDPAARALLETAFSSITPLPGAATGDLVPIDQAIETLLVYAQELYSWNPRYKLLSTRDGSRLETIVERHIVDSLRPAAIIAEVIRETAVDGVLKLYDLGSGAGLPGIPLAVVLPLLLGTGIDTVLVEKSGRRVRFLNYAIARMNLKRTKVEAVDFSRLTVGGDSPVCITFRAVSELSDELNDTLSRVFPAGSPVIAYKGRAEASLAESSRIGGDVIAVPQFLPGDLPRSIVRYRVGSNK